MKYLAYLYLFFVSLIVSGCASLDDFRAMSSAQRAERACKRVVNFSPEKNELYNLEDMARDINKKISTGYTPREECTWVERPRELRLNCSNNGSGTTCRESALNSRIVYSCAELTDALNGKITLPVNPQSALAFNCDRKCITYHIPLDKNSLEREKSDILNRMADIERRIAHKYNSCYSSVLRMNADESFVVYKNKSFP